MLPRPRRVHTKAHYDEVFRRGQRFRGVNLAVSVVAAEGPARVGVITGKRFSVLAVKRNRVKRQLRAVARELLPDLKDGHLIVIHAGATRSNLSYQDLVTEVRSLLKKAKAL